MMGRRSYLFWHFLIVRQRCLGRSGGRSLLAGGHGSVRLCSDGLRAGLGDDGILACGLLAHLGFFHGSSRLRRRGCVYRLLVIRGDRRLFSGAGLGDADRPTERRLFWSLRRDFIFDSRRLLGLLLHGWGEG